MKSSRFLWVVAAALQCTAIQAAVVISPAALPDWTVNIPYSQTLTASGCVLPCGWSWTGNTPPGLSLDSVSGAIAGLPGSAGSYQFTVTASNVLASGSQSYTVVINPAPRITTATLANGQAGNSYSQTIAVSGGTPPYKFSTSAGSLPAALTLNTASGLISGTAIAAGSFDFTVLLTDNVTAKASQAYTLTIGAAGNSGTPTIVTTTLPQGTVGVAYSQTLTASGGTPPYSWSAVSGALPGGLVLASTGVITGSPSVAGSFTFTVRVTDHASLTADHSLSIVIQSASSGTPTITFTGLSGTASSGQQIAFGLKLSSAYSSPVTGKIALTFQPDGALTDDPAIQFASGGRTLTFTVPANATSAVFSVSPVAFQTGTVAGVITLAVSSTLSGANPSQAVAIARAAPVIQSASVVLNSSGFNLQLTGFSNSRELIAAAFHFVAVSGSPLQTSDVSVPLSTPASQWYSASSSDQFGGQFLIVVPFTIQQGATSGLASVSSQLQNAQNTSAAVSAPF